MKTIVAVLLCVFCLAGCGKRGKLDFPPGTTYPRQYPARHEPRQIKRTLQSIPSEKQPESIWEINESLETEK